MNPCSHCGVVDGHRIDCIEAAKTQPHAMVNSLDEVFYPGDIEDACVFAREESAWPLDWDYFPFLTPEQHRLSNALPYDRDTADVHDVLADDETLGGGAKRMAIINRLSTDMMSSHLIRLSVSHPDVFDKIVGLWGDEGE